MPESENNTCKDCIHFKENKCPSPAFADKQLCSRHNYFVGPETDSCGGFKNKSEDYNETEATQQATN